MAVRKRPSDYQENSIRVLKGLEPVKSRPGMYTLTDNPLHIIQEVLDNASDEVLGGFGDTITLTMCADGSVAVEDNGRGIPVGIHPTEGIPTVELVFTQLHAGGKFDKAQAAPIAFGRFARRRRLGRPTLESAFERHGLARRQAVRHRLC